MTPPPSDILILLGEAVAAQIDPRVLCLDATNGPAGWRALHEAVAIGGPFCVTPDSRMLAVDSDDPACAALVWELAGVLVDRRIQPVVLNSGGGAGRLHLFARIDHRGLFDAIAARAKAGGLDLRHHSPIRPPGSPHRTGGHSQLLVPGSWSEALAALQGAPPSGRLPQRLWSLIRYGAPKGAYRHPDGSIDDSAVAMAICNLAVANEIPKARVWALLSLVANRGGSSIQKRLDRGPGVAQRWFDRTWARAVNDVGNRRAFQGRNDALIELADIRAHAEQWQPSGRTAGSDACVLIGCISLAEKLGGPVAPLAVRAVAQHSGRSVPTVRSAMRRLQEAGWLEMVRCSRGEQAAVWRIMVPREICTASLPPGGRGTGQSSRELPPNHDAFTPGALGATGWRALCLIGDEQYTIKDVADQLRLHPATIARCMHRLLDAGLVERLDDDEWRRTPGDVSSALYEVSERAGCDGRLARREELFARQRHNYRLWLVHTSRPRRQRLHQAQSQASLLFAGQAVEVRWSSPPDLEVAS